MKLLVEINNLSLSPVGKDFFVRVIEKTLDLSGYVFLKNKNVSLSLALVSEGEMKKINKTYRQKNAVTDVLSFSEYKSRKSLEKIGDKDIFLGEIILCYNYIAEYAKKNNDKANSELARVASHGTLHLLGFRHGEKMFALQEEVAQNCVK